MPGLLVCVFSLLPYFLLDQDFFSSLKEFFLIDRLNNIHNYKKIILYIFFQILNNLFFFTLNYIIRKKILNI